MVKKVGMLKSLRSRRVGSQPSTRPWLAWNPVKTHNNMCKRYIIRLLKRQDQIKCVFLIQNKIKSQPKKTPTRQQGDKTTINAQYQSFFTV